MVDRQDSSADLPLFRRGELGVIATCGFTGFSRTIAAKLSGQLSITG